MKVPLLFCTAIALAAGNLNAQRPPQEIAPAVARINATYSQAPDGREFFDIRLAAIDPLSGALWVKYGKESEPPVRIDRKTGVGRVIGRTGKGPNEYSRIIAMNPAPTGEMGIWDPARLLWFWVNATGNQVRTWPLATTNLMYGKVFTDTRGGVYLGQPGQRASAGSPHRTVVVRLDSARGLVDTVALPLNDTQRGSWTSQTGPGSSSTIFVMFSPRVDWGVDALGRIFAAWTDSNYVIVRENGRDARRLLPPWREAVTPTERNAANAALDAFAANARARRGVLGTPRPDIPTLKPQIEALMPEMTGGILVRRTRSCSNSPAWRAPGTGAVAASDTLSCAIIERFDARGERLAPFSLLSGDRLLVMRADTAWVARSDADGLTKILELVVPRRRQ